jgi:hypothetical protein
MSNAVAHKQLFGWEYSLIQLEDKLRAAFRAARGDKALTDRLNNLEKTFGALRFALYEAKDEAKEHPEAPAILGGEVVHKSPCFECENHEEGDCPRCEDTGFWLDDDCRCYACDALRDVLLAEEATL